MILVVGGTGFLGGKITNVLLSKHLPVTLLVRPISLNKPDVVEFQSLGAKIVSGDADSVEDLEKALKNIDYVVSATMKPQHEYNLFEAIKKSSIKLYVPSFWYPDPQNLVKGENVSWDAKRDLLNQVVESQVPYTILFTGMFLDSPGFVGIDLLNSAFLVFGDGNQSIPVIHTSNIADVIPYVLKGDFVNKKLHLEGDRYSTNDAIAWLGSDGKRWNKVHLEEKDLEEKMNYYKDFNTAAIMNILWQKCIFFSKKLLFDSDIHLFSEIKLIKAKDYFQGWLDGKEEIYPE